MARLYPPACPATANAGERVLFAAAAAFLDATWTGWFQAALPGRGANPRRAATPFHADLILLGAAGLTVVEVKGWRAASITEADDSRVAFRNGARAQHPLVQAYRYAATLAALLRAQPGVLGRAPVPVHYAAALPYVRAADLADASWAPAFRGDRLLLAEDLGPPFAAALDRLPPIGGTVTPAQHAALTHLFTRAAHLAPAAHWPPLFEE
ncbi:MAG TPA: nuclease-related domain-containing protein [Chloroflexia bacterium]|nr:nuclease-related domain-containing protein [Chloroflexia bacterium]